VAKQCLNRIYKKGFRYHKTGVMLLDLAPKTIHQLDLFSFTATTSIPSPKINSLMRTLDHINNKFGKGSLFICAEGMNHNWKLRCNHRSPRYTTRWKEIALVKC
jgi:DNA polymerase V